MLVYGAETSLPSVEAAVATTRTMPEAPLWPVEADNVGLAGEVRLNRGSLYDTQAIGCPMRRARVKFPF
jgi:hypothetical protein